MHSTTDIPHHAVAVRRIEGDFPGWRVWVSDTGRWWAFRAAARPLNIQQMRAGCRLIVQADTSEALQTAIAAEIEASHRVD